MRATITRRATRMIISLLLSRGFRLLGLVFIAYAMLVSSRHNAESANIYPQNNPVRRARTSHCYCSSDMGQSTMYFSAAFDLFLPAGAPDLKYHQMEDSFKQTIQQKYGYEGNAVCFGNYKTLAEVQADEQKRITEMRASKKWKIIETGWTYNGAPPIVASGKGKPSYCFGYNGNTGYFSDIFEVPPHTPLIPVVVDGFARFVIEKYGLEPGRNGTGSWEGGVTCPSSDNKDADKRYGREKGYKIIETGWKPKSLPPPNLGPA